MSGVAAAEAYWREPEAPVPDLELRLDELLVAAEREVPDREALVYIPSDGAEVRFSYRELASAVEAASQALIATGVRRGGVVAVYSSNRPEFVILQLACSRLGAAAVPVNPLYSADEVAYVLEHSGSEVCFVGGEARGADLVARLDSVSAALPRLRSRVRIDGAGGSGPVWEDWLVAGEEVATGEVESVLAAASPEDVAEIQFTSGTTGRPKAVQLRSSALANGGRRCAHRSDLEEGCRYLHAMPFFHVGGTVTAMASILAVKGTHLFLPSFSPTAVCAAIERERATVVLAVPTMMISLAERAEAAGCSFAQLRVVVTGGALVPEHVARHWIDTYGVGLSNTYGMTEITGPAVQTSPLDPLERALESVGRPLPGVEVDVVEVGGEQRVGLGEPGEIRFRGPALMNGYLGDPEATAAVLGEDRWLRSGDIGVLGEDGFLAVTGRAKDLIIRGGENIAPATIEDAIRAHVDEVVDVSVIGVPDDYYGEAVAAYVRLRDGSPPLSLEGLRERLRAHLAPFMLPAHLRVVETLPTTPSGKVQKFRLRESFAAEK